MSILRKTIKIPLKFKNFRNNYLALALKAVLIETVKNIDLSIYSEDEFIQKSFIFEGDEELLIEEVQTKYNLPSAKEAVTLALHKVKNRAILFEWENEKQ